MASLRILLLAPGANPETISANLVGYRHAEALACLHDVTLVIGAATEEAVRRAGAPFRGIEVIRQPWLNRIPGPDSESDFQGELSQPDGYRSPLPAWHGF